MDKVVHFEITFDDQERAKKFYQSAFGWELYDNDMGNG
ncbi:MAG TPA: VOC family protein, partial [Actinomycetota bacterium]|nr:VOC family protein [Actinomycetota bacterium]